MPFEQVSYDSDASDPYPQHSCGMIKTSQDDSSDDIGDFNKNCANAHMIPGIETKKDRSIFKKLIRKTIIGKLFKGAKRRMLRKYSTNYLMSQNK